jgi:hypothetical protein
MHRIQTIGFTAETQRTQRRACIRLAPLRTLRLCGESLQLSKAAPFSGDKTPRLHPIRWHHLPGRPQAGSYVVRLLRLGMFGYATGMKLDSPRRRREEHAFAWPLCALCASAVNPCSCRRQHPSSGKGAALASDPLASPARSPASGLLRRPTSTAGNVRLCDRNEVGFTAETQRRACIRLAPLRTPRLRGASLHLLKAAPFFRERRGACVRSAGITCQVARKRAPTSSDFYGWECSAI